MSSEASQISSGDFTAVFNLYWKKLYVIAYRRVGDEEIAKDIVQDVFVYYWNNKDVIKVGVSIEAYLRRATQFQVIAHFRKNLIHSNAVSYLLERMNQVELGINDLLTEKDISRVVHSEIKEMPDTMQQIFKLRVEDQTVPEIAGHLGIAEKTVRNNISMGLVRLKKALAKDFPDDFSTISLIFCILWTGKF
jgi:RNA polymerase sigma factor (sigma-70 family)